MDWNRAEGNWKEFQGKVKENWGKRTDDDLTPINGKRDQLGAGFNSDMVLRKIRCATTLTAGSPRSRKLLIDGRSMAGHRGCRGVRQGCARRPSLPAYLKSVGDRCADFVRPKFRASYRLPPRSGLSANNCRLEDQNSSLP
jgi:hypothetical protein